MSLNKIEQFLSPVKFLKTYRSYILNLDYLKDIEPYEKENYVANSRTKHNKEGYAKLKEVLMNLICSSPNFS